MNKFDELCALVAAGRVSHTRAGIGLYRGAILVYERNEESPTGVTLAMSIDDTPEVMEVLRGGVGLSPLSPTEPR